MMVNQSMIRIRRFMERNVKDWEEEERMDGGGGELCEGTART